MSRLCHAHGCYTAVPPKMFMCKPHWFMLPADLRDAIWREYRPGQEITKNPSPRYMAVQKLAVARVAFKPNDKCSTCGEADNSTFRSSLCSDAWHVTGERRVMTQYLLDAKQWRAAAIKEGLGDPLWHLLETP